MLRVRVGVVLRAESRIMIRVTFMVAAKVRMGSGYSKGQCLDVVVQG